VARGGRIVHRRLVRRNHSWTGLDHYIISNPCPETLASIVNWLPLTPGFPFP